MVIRRTAFYAGFAIRHDWTPRQVDEEIPADLLPWWIEVENMLQDVSRQKAEREARHGNG